MYVLCTRMELTETEKEVINILNSRWKIGREKYGEGISYRQSEKLENWIEQAIEEAADLLQYLVALKMRLKNQTDKRKNP